MVYIYKVIGENNIMGDLLSQVLSNRGIEDKEKFLNPSSEDVIHYSNLKNIDKAVELFDKHKKSGSTVVVIVDSDCDGFTSASVIIQHMRKHHSELNVLYLIHEKRANGLTEQMMSSIHEIKPELVILPDSGSNDREQTKELHESNIDTLILDHHIMESKEENKYAVVVNPQLCLDSYPNENLAAAGIVYKFVQALDDRYGTRDADNYLDLVAVSTIADTMEQTEPESRYYIYKGLSNIQNPFLKKLMEKNADWTKEIYPRIISFSGANHMNACIRVGTMEDKETMLRAMLAEEEITTRTTKRRGVSTKVKETLAEKAVRLCSNARSRQNRAKNKHFKIALDQVKENGLDKNKFIVVELDDLPSGFSGLVAMSLASTFNRPSVVVSKGEDGRYLGSLRGNSGTSGENLKQHLIKTELFEFVRGHEGAAGLAISEDNFKLLNDSINSTIHFESEQGLTEVDFEIHSNSLTEELIKEVDGMAKYFGKGCEEPKFAVKNVELRCDEGNFGNTMKFTKGSVEIMSFSVDQRIAELAKSRMIATVDLVGTLGLNRFLGRVTPQMIVEEIIIRDTKKDSVGGFVF